jgi:hypothetical protein
MIRADERAVSEQVGMILLFGFLVVSMSMYQATVVPQENGAVEFRHGERVRADMVALSGAIDSAAVGQPRSAEIELGTRYPRRTLFVNPPPATGTLRSEDIGTVTIRNARAVGNEETADYWDGSDRRFETDRLVYEPSYHAGQREPTTTIEHGLVFTEHAGGKPVVEDEQTLISGKGIRLVSLSASLSRTDAGKVSLSPDDVSAATRTVAITGADGSEPLVLTLPTTLEESTWEELLADEMRPENVAVEGSTLRLELDGSATYRLRMANVSVDTSESVSGVYVTAERRTVYPSQRGDGFTVEVRDRFNNPVAGVGVAANRSDLLVNSTAETGSDGRATFRYSGDGSGVVAFEIGTGGEPYEIANVTVRPPKAGGPGERRNGNRGNGRIVG